MNDTKVEGVRLKDEVKEGEGKRKKEEREEILTVSLFRS